MRGNEASEELVEAADRVKASLLVIGIRRRSPTGKLITGSQAQRVLLDANCPVLAVKASDERTPPPPLARSRRASAGGPGHQPDCRRGSAEQVEGFARPLRKVAEDRPHALGQVPGDEGCRRIGVAGQQRVADLEVLGGRETSVRCGSRCERLRSRAVCGRSSAMVRRRCSLRVASMIAQSNRSASS